MALIPLNTDVVSLIYSIFYLYEKNSIFYILVKYKTKLNI